MALFAATSDPLVSGFTPDPNYHGGYGPCDFPVIGVKIFTKSRSHPGFDTQSRVALQKHETHAGGQHQRAQLGGH